VDVQAAAEDQRFSEAETRALVKRDQRGDAGVEPNRRHGDPLIGAGHKNFASTVAGEGSIRLERSGGALPAGQQKQRPGAEEKVDE